MTTTEKNIATIIGSSEIQCATEGTKAFRIVCRFLGAHANMPLVVHLETFNAQGEHDGFHNGDYCGNMIEAYEALKKHAAKYSLRVLDANGKRIPLKTLNEVI